MYLVANTEDVALIVASSVFQKCRVKMPNPCVFMGFFDGNFVGAEQRDVKRFEFHRVVLQNVFGTFRNNFAEYRNKKSKGTLNAIRKHF